MLTSDFIQALEREDISSTEAYVLFMLPSMVSI